MISRRQHQLEVKAFLQQHFSHRHWELALPHGSGSEKYLASAGEHLIFVKLGGRPECYQVLASLGLTPPILAVGNLDDGTPLLAQLFINGRTPTRKDFHQHLKQFAVAIRATHSSPILRRILPDVPDELYASAGQRALAGIQRRWERCRLQVPGAAGFVDESLTQLGLQVQSFQAGGLVASHNDICNANWLVSREGRVYLLDLDAMSLEDPACDLGAILWWYYPPDLRGRFLEIAGYPDDEGFRHRMQIRMTMHCLHILLPREGSFDRFNADDFTENLVDFRAALAGKENPQGYLD